MKKKVFATLICAIMVFVFPLFLFGCNEQNHTKEDVDLLYTSIKTNKETSQFFSGENLIVTFDGTKVNTFDRNDKSYIFSQVYSYYLASSSRLFSVVMERAKTPSFVLRNFTSKEVNQIYNNMQNLNSAMLNFSESKKVYEESHGNLYYNDFLSSYNNFLTSIYNFNQAFASAYFNSVGKLDLSKTTLDDSDIRDFLSYQLMLASKVSFSYELKSFKPSNPLGEVLTWYSNTTQINNFVTIANKCLQKIDSRNAISSNNNSLTISLFENLEEYASFYNNEYKYFEQALTKCNLKNYIAEADKNFYLENCSPVEKSSINIIEYFLNGRYLSVIKCLDQISNTIVA